jgi:mannose-6-phosphate isomerase-like protein (cupin superfamily)
MSKLIEFLESGVLELYVMGLSSDSENKEVELMRALHDEVNSEIELITEALISHGSVNVATPNTTVKPLIIANVDYIERLKNGEAPSDPPILNTRSTIAEYKEWLDRPDMVSPEEYEEIFIKFISQTPKAICAIVWIRHETPAETHSIEHEKFLIVEGTCDIIVNAKVHSLVPGDYMSIPLFADHIVKVTSDIPCKVILQRVAA